MKPETCNGCPCRNMGTDFSAVEIGARYETTRLLLVGESSGEAEAREGLPFRPYAQSGSLLSDAMREVAINRSEVAITNVLRCRPKNDWLDTAPYQYAATSQCIREHLIPTVRDLRPRAILALGGTAFRALTSAPKGRYGTLDYARGYVMMGTGAAEGVPVIPTYHPSFLRRGAAHLTPLLHRDLRRAFLLATGRLVEGRHFSTRLSDLDLKYQTSPTIDDAWYWMNQVEPSCKLSYDLETPMSARSDEDERVGGFTDRDIKLIQFTQRRDEGIAFPWRDEYIDVAKETLKRCPCKVGYNNWNYDDDVLRHNDIEIGETDDAMVKFGTYWSDLPKNLQAAAQMAGFKFPWKFLSESDLPFYGCADVDAALCVDDYMDRVLTGEMVA